MAASGEGEDTMGRLEISENQGRGMVYAELRGLRESNQETCYIRVDPHKEGKC